MARSRADGLVKVLCAIVAAAALGGCSLERPGSGKVVTVAIRGGRADIQAWEDMRDAFEAEHRGIRIRLEHIPDRQYYAKLLAMLAGNSAPDVFALTNGTILPHISKGTLLDLRPLVRKDSAVNLTDFFEKALAGYEFDGGLYGMPVNFHAFALYYNKDLFREMGVPFPDNAWDWQTLLGAAKRLTKDRDGDGRIDQYGIVYDSWLGAVAPWIWQNGGDIFDDPDHPVRCVVGAPEAVQALQFLQDMKIKHRVAPGASETTEQGIVEMFYSGRVAMYPYLYIAGRMKEYARGFEWDCAPLPMGPGGERVSWAGSGCLCINRKTKLADESWQFVKFATGPQGMRIDARNQIAIPARKSIAYSEAFLRPGTPPANKRVFFDALSYARLNPNLIDLPDFLTVFQEQIDRLFLGEVDAAGAARVISARANSALSKARREQKSRKSPGRT